MTKTSINLQALRQRIYQKAKSEPTHRFRGLFTHIIKLSTLSEANRQAKKNGGAPGIDGQSLRTWSERASGSSWRAFAQSSRPEPTSPSPIVKWIFNAANSLPHCILRPRDIYLIYIIILLRGAVSWSERGFSSLDGVRRFAYPSNSGLGVRKSL